MKSLNYFNTGKIPQPQLPGYIFSEKLGSGSYAVVYKACPKQRKEEVVAVKCILRSSLNNISKENLLTEIELMKSFKHEHIVNLRDFSWDETYIYLILEYCAGGDLMSFLKSRKVVSERVAKMFLQQLASGLKYMRSKLVCHMDLKPSNILLTSAHNPIVKIADFGFAHYLSGSTDAMFIRGSLLYMAPEIVTRGSYDEKADLWSVGVILYECLFGRAPFASRTLTELERKITSSDPIEIPSKPSSSSSQLISESCLDLLEGLLKRDVDERMGYDEFFIHPFVDLIHIPTEDSLPTATELVNKATAMDARKNYKSALRFYCEALQYFMAAIQFETDCHKKDVIRSKVNKYIERAEELKKILETDVTSVAAEEVDSANVSTPKPSTSNSSHSECKKASNNEDSHSQLC
ncbi:hypothetical protein HELRODRAFT_107367 [Helobdella robusta]|uniref:Serine/threonine-protein kinase ULK3 n=1 Tax=Helobdella robusta TaxID=6412 RepID=T1EEA0_HELRO|nr:hypothetical protein HELRODRAFT_107367 [Helobdella robusta]ESN96205.1 hypothetical protein HELRODRAFT_107367 [Helobdella robusta]